MNIVVPINVEVLRVSARSGQNAKTALYDFSGLGGSPLAGTTRNLIAAKIFGDAFEPLKALPGIHLHWSIPRLYTQGQQDRNKGTIQFNALPNRWLVTRFFKDITKDPSVPADSPVGVTSWILESDAHDADSGNVNSATTIPWMDDTTNLYGMQFHYAGNKIPLTKPWQEPDTDTGYLGARLQAPFAYGETFTAYYQNCGNLFGLYDDLADAFKEFKKNLPKQTFSISYIVTGWVSPGDNDACTKILQSAVAD